MDRAMSRLALLSILSLGALAWIALSLITQSSNSTKNWRQGLWGSDGPSPWLLFPMIAAATALFVLYSERRKWVSGISVPVVLSLQFLCALAWMTCAQLRGRPELGEFESANKLLPFSFLVIGAIFWPKVEKVRLLGYLIFCGCAAVTLGYAWLGEGMILAAGVPYAPWVGAGALLVPLFWLRFPEYLICSLGGFFVFTALGTGARFGGIDPHAFRDQLQSLSMARERIEIVRQGRAVRFWYDNKDAAMRDALALTSTYPSERSLLSRSFSAAPCDKNLLPSTILAVVSANPLRPDFVASALSACPNEKGLRAGPIEIDTLHNGTSGYQMSLLSIEVAPSASP